MIQRRIAVTLAMLVAAALLVATAAYAGSSSSTKATSSKNSVIRFVFSPDPVWDYMKDKGIIEQMGQKAGIDIVQMETWDEWALFAGGHADVISTGSYETPLLDAKGIKTVTFGKYNMSKDLMVTANPKYKTAADMPKGCKVAAEDVTGNATLWRALIKKISHRDLAENGKDLKLVIADYQIMPTLVAKGDVCASFSDPTQITKDLRTGKVHPMYNGMSASQLYGKYIVKGHQGIESNNFVAKKSWFDTHQKEAAFFLKVWQKGLDLFYKNPDAVVDAEPVDFAIQSPADAAWIKNYLKHQFNFFNKSVYLTPKWIQGEMPLFKIIQANGELPKSLKQNLYAVINPKTGKVTAMLGGK